MLRFTLFLSIAGWRPAARAWQLRWPQGHGAQPLWRQLAFHVAKLRIPQLANVINIVGKNTNFTEKKKGCITHPFFLT